MLIVSLINTKCFINNIIINCPRYTRYLNFIMHNVFIKIAFVKYLYNFANYGARIYFQGKPWNSITQFKLNTQLFVSNSNRFLLPLIQFSKLNPCYCIIIFLLLSKFVEWPIFFFNFKLLFLKHHKRFLSET